MSHIVKLTTQITDTVAVAAAVQRATPPLMPFLDRTRQRRGLLLR